MQTPPGAPAGAGLISNGDLSASSVKVVVDIIRYFQDVSADPSPQECAAAQPGLAANAQKMKHHLEQVERVVDEVRSVPREGQGIFAFGLATVQREILLLAASCLQPDVLDIIASMRVLQITYEPDSLEFAAGSQRLLWALVDAGLPAPPQSMIRQMLGYGRGKGMMPIKSMKETASVLYTQMPWLSTARLVEIHDDPDEYMPSPTTGLDLMLLLDLRRLAQQAKLLAVDAAEKGSEAPATILFPRFGKSSPAEKLPSGGRLLHPVCGGDVQPHHGVRGRGVVPVVSGRHVQPVPGGFGAAVVPVVPGGFVPARHGGDMEQAVSDVSVGNVQPQPGGNHTGFGLPDVPGGKVLGGGDMVVDDGDRGAHLVRHVPGGLGVRRGLRGLLDVSGGLFQSGAGHVLVLGVSGGHVQRVGGV